MLEIQSLSVAFGDHPVLRNVSLSLHQGEILAVIGPNGAGKSTLIRAVSGVIPIRSGCVRVTGQDLARFSPSQRAAFISVVPQARDLPAAFSVYQTVLIGRTPHLGWLGKANTQDHWHARQALEHTHLQQMAERSVGELSGGEQQRVLLARALAQDTPVLLLDEPTTHLDLKYQSSFLQLVRELVINQKLSVLMVMHDLNLAGLYADRAALIVEGRIRCIGRPDEVLTEDNLVAVYDIPVHVIPHPEYGNPIILPDGKNRNNDPI